MLIVYFDIPTIRSNDFKSLSYNQVMSPINIYVLLYNTKTNIIIALALWN